MAQMRGPGSRPFPDRPEGSDCLPGIDHIVVLMKENHSYDNYFGMLGKGDGFTLGPDGTPENSNPDAGGRPVRAHHLSLPLNPSLHVSQTWNSSHRQWNGGAMDGFVTATGSDMPMGYLDGSDLPWYYSFAATFGIADRYFSSVMAQTFPNRRFLQAATAAGLVSTAIPNPFTKPPATGLIWDLLNSHDISWVNYHGEVPDLALWPRNLLRWHSHLRGLDDFHEDCRAGTLPAVSLVSPEFFSDEGEFEDDQVGEAATASLFEAASAGPQWPRMLFVIAWDEGGGFYDHVPPPEAPVPDDIPPDIHVPPDEPGGYDRYGFRVPCLVASPFAKPGHVSSVVYDHTSILATIEAKWNLPALTHRDAAASPLTDFLDLGRPPHFPTPPPLQPPTIWPFTGKR